MFIPSNNPGNMKKNNKIIPKPKTFPRSDLIFFFPDNLEKKQLNGTLLIK
jgi:hypothetical protein